MASISSSISTSISWHHNFVTPSSSSISTNRPYRPTLTVIRASSLKSGNSTTEENRELLKQYGLDPDEFLSDPTTPSKSSRRKKGQEKSGRGKQGVATPTTHEQSKPRETHKLLQVLGGTARRKKLLSPKSMDVRPMMEVVKGAAFGILQAAGGCPTSLRPGRWLDLYSGTGSVGIEAISRGCSEVHFVEMDPWVVSDVLRPNLEWTNFLDNSVIHTVRVETYLERTKDGPFDYISVTPPYMLVDYEILMKQISESSVIGDDSFIVVEYPFRTDMLETCGCLVKLADRRFGRTHLAIYGPKWAQKKGRS
uniref:putative rRNA methyltransferase YlbH n=1 Tax=Erigeron canadensis TaxID=72917 RepID=UPI001CB8F019|nr:putative rRNA methyltransferase YlbH [Erigeron canadensis]